MRLGALASGLGAQQVKCAAVCVALRAGGLARAMQGVKSVIALGRLGALLPAAQRAGVERVVLLSTAGERQSYSALRPFLLDGRGVFTPATDTRPCSRCCMCCSHRHAAARGCRSAVPEWSRCRAQGCLARGGTQQQLHPTHRCQGRHHPGRTWWQQQGQRGPAHWWQQPAQHITRGPGQRVGRERRVPA